MKLPQCVEQSQMGQPRLPETWKGQAGGWESPDSVTVWPPTGGMRTGNMSHFPTPQGQLDSEVPGVPGLQLSSTVTEPHLPPKPTFLGRPTMEMPPQNCLPVQETGRKLQHRVLITSEHLEPWLLL